MRKLCKRCILYHCREYRLELSADIAADKVFKVSI